MMDSPRINLAETADFDLGGLRVSPARREVRLDGKRRELEPKVTQVLVALASARSTVVSRARLIEQCWDGRVVGDDAINRCIVALRHLAKEYAPAPFAIETVPRVGYSLIERPLEERARSGAFNRRSLALAALLILAIIAGVVFLARSPLGVGKPDPASIAVTPFRNLSSGQPYFAEGVGEEIVSQLAREPQFRVIGRASAGQTDRGSDAREVGKQLGVDYVLEGSVATQGDRVRVIAGLVKASDGSQLWSNSYNGHLEDMFTIQQRIGSAIAAALKRKLIRAPVLTGPLVTNGDAYNLYLTARGLIRTRNRRVGRTASDLLRDAIKLDPGYAPAWAALADAVRLEGALQDHERFVAATRQARLYARQALRLAPDLAEAHRVLASSLEYGTAEARVHALRAVELEPNSAENLIELGGAQAATGNFRQERATYRRAQELDPLWFRTVGISAMTVAALGDRAAAEAIAQNGDRHNQVVMQILLGRIAWIFADYSEAARRWAIVARARSPRWSHTAQRTVTDAKHAVGLRSEPLVTVPRPSSQPSSWRVWMDSPPDPSTWRARNRDPITSDVYHDENEMAAKLMLNSGRAAELMEAYRGPAGLLGVRPGKPIRVDQVRVVPEVAMALHRSGRAAEGDRILAEAEAAIDGVYRRNRPPFWFDADAAAVLALRGKADQALSRLEAAWARGWRHAGSSDLRKLSDEPAFASLRGSARFKRIEAKLAAHYARERREIEQLGI